MEKQNFTRLEVLDIIAEIDDNGIDNEAITYVQILDTIINKLARKKQLTIPVVGSTLPDFLYESNNGLYFAYREDTDIKQEWEEYLKNR